MTEIHMNDEAAVEPQDAEPMDEIMEQHAAEPDSPEESNNEKEPREKTMIPLSVAQKLRQQKRDLELELQWERSRNAQAQAPQAPPEDDGARYESATREDLVKSQEQAIRIAEERFWSRANPEKVEYVNENLKQFLKQRPHLAAAIELAPNRYEEAFELMDKLSPKQKQTLREAPPKPKKEAPNAPGSVPKAAALDSAENLMKMSDAEFTSWRQSKRKSR